MTTKLGVNLKPLISPEKTSFEKLTGKVLAFDANNMLYQFLALIRTSKGELFKDSQGRVTSHLNGLIFRLTKFLDYNIKPVLVFDGPPLKLKMETLKKRRKQREKAEKEWLEALKEEDYFKAWSKAVQTSTLTKQMVKETKELLTYMGIPFVQAPSDAEAQAAYMASRKQVYASCSRDYDSILFGSPRLLRYLTFTGKKYLRTKKSWYRLTPEKIELKKILKELKITRQQLVDIALLVGTDFNEGVRRIGPKKAYLLVKKYGGIKELIESGKISFKGDVDALRKIFLEPKVIDCVITWHKPDRENLISFLCEERNFKEERVETVIKRLNSFFETQKQLTIQKWTN